MSTQSLYRTGLIFAILMSLGWIAWLAGSMSQPDTSGLGPAAKLMAVVVFLAAMIGTRGLALWLSNNERIGLGVGDDVAGLFGAVFSGKLLMIGTFLLLCFAQIASAGQANVFVYHRFGDSRFPSTMSGRELKLDLDFVRLNVGLIYFCKNK